MADSNEAAAKAFKTIHKSSVNPTKSTTMGTSSAARLLLEFLAIIHIRFDHKSQIIH